MQGGMMLYQYHCACCDKVVASTDKECPYCGSQHKRSPFGLWMFCVSACFGVVVVIKFVHLYSQHYEEEPPAQTSSIFEIFKQDSTESNK
jgi:hypothetical protein